MTTQAVGALLRASWWNMRSYRISLALQMGGLLFTVVPLYLVANALQPTMAEAIAPEAEQFFGFVLIGSIGLMFASAALTTLQSSIASGISTGYFESLLMTRATLPSILVGMTSYGMTVTIVRAAIMLAAGWFLGARIVWSGTLSALVILGLLVVTHWSIGMLGAALVIAFRTAGPLTQIVTTVSVVFGGVYVPVSAIPSWLGSIAKATPLSYGLTSLRRVLIQGESLRDVAPDVGILAVMGAVSLVLGSIAIQSAMRYARKSGTLGTY